MKFRPKYWTCFLLAGGVFCLVPAIFAGPRGKEVHFGFTVRTLDFLNFTKSSKRDRILSEKYLSADYLPVVPIYREEPHVSGLQEFPVGQAPVFSTPQPSLRDFLNRLEADKAESAPSRMADGESSDGLTDSKETVETIDSEPGVGQADGGEQPIREGGEGPPLKPNDPEVLARFFGTTDPRGDNGPVFPKPTRFGESVDRFFMYFPLKSDEGSGTEPGMIMLPINSEAIFQPPGNANMRSSATLREGT